MAQACNPSYWGAIDWEDCGSRTAQGKKLSRPISSANKESLVTHICYPSSADGVRRGIMVQSGLGKNMRPYLKSNYSNKAGGRTQVVQCLPSKCKAWVQIQHLTHTHTHTHKEENHSTWAHTFGGFEDRGKAWLLSIDAIWREVIKRRKRTLADWGKTLIDGHLG
jgi:hypothetical protein